MLLDWRPTERRTVARSGRAGFTFVELLVVTVILMLMLSVMTPLFRASLSAVKSRSAVRGLVASVIHTQERAVSGAQEYRVCFDLKAKTYWVERCSGLDSHRKKQFEAIQDSFGRLTHLPSFFEVSAGRSTHESEGGDLLYLGCYPSGACDPVELTLNDSRRGERVTVRTKGFMGKIEVERS